MFLEINANKLFRKSVYEYIASSIETKFPDSKCDADKIRNAKNSKEVKFFFNEYFEGWNYNNVKFPFDDIDNIIYWMDKETELHKKALEYQKWINWLADRGVTPEQISKAKKS